jgi:hypothetical protein
MTTYAPEQQIQIDSKNARFCIVCAIVVSIVTAIGVVVLALLQPDTTAIPIVIGITTPVITALIGAGFHGGLSAIDGRMTQLLNVSAKAEHSQGVVEGLAINPKTNVSAEDVVSVVDRRGAP